MPRLGRRKMMFGRQFNAQNIALTGEKLGDAECGLDIIEYSDDSLHLNQSTGMDGEEIEDRTENVPITQKTTAIYQVEVCSQSAQIAGPSGAATRVNPRAGQKEVIETRRSDKSWNVWSPSTLKSKKHPALNSKIAISCFAKRTWSLRKKKGT